MVRFRLLCGDFLLPNSAPYLDNRITVCMGYPAMTLPGRAGKRRRKGAGNPWRENGAPNLMCSQWYAPYNRDIEIGKGLKWANEKRSIQSLESGSLKNALQGECEDERLPDEQVFLPLQCESGSACTKWMGLQHLRLQMPRELIARRSRKSRKGLSDWETQLPNALRKIPSS